MKILDDLISHAETEYSLIEIISNNIGKIVQNFLVNVDLEQYISKLESKKLKR
jgi:hypothetical protein